MKDIFPMKVLFCILLLSFCAVIYAYISRVLQNDIEDRDRVYPYTVWENNPDAGPNNIFWFVQVTDIHISRYYDSFRAPDLKRFCDTHLDVIKPEFVVATGDLTDAKFRDKMGSKQYLEEWEKYHDAVVHCKNTVKTWLDLRGNHDAFDTPDLDHENNLFRHYSSQGKDHPTSYVYHHTKTFGRYSFIGVDATPNPGPKRPFNFFGYIQQDGEKLINRYLFESRHSNLTMAFGHYPTSVIATQTGSSIRHILRNVTGYLCGHLHTLGGLIPQMWARQRTGMLEMELGDWKDERIYRVVAIDHDMLSISDEKLGKWPVVMVTNPKQASLLSPHHEPLLRMINSSHIRILVFSPNGINNIEVYIDDIHQGKAVHSKGPLYVLPWRPAKFMKGLHTIKVVVQGSVQNRHVHEHVFSLDETSPLLPFKSRFVLMLDLGSFCQTVFYLVVIVYTGTLTVLRRCNNIKMFRLTSQSFFLKILFQHYNNWLYRLWLVAKTTRLFYSLVGFMLYLATGPWVIGELMEGTNGFVFVWGLYLQGSYLPMYFLTYIYGFFQLITFNVPLTMYVGYLLQYSQVSPKTRTLWHATRHTYLPFIALMVFQIYMTMSEFPAAYGTRALVMGPMRTGSVILAIVVFVIARRTNVSAILNSHVS